MSKLSLSFLTDLTSPGIRSFAEEVVNEWNTHHLTAPVELSTVDHEEFRDRMAEYLTHPKPPDILTWFAGNRMQSLGERGLMHDISSVWEEYALADPYLPRFRKMVEHNTPAYFFPTSHYWWAFYYRPSIFESLGITTPVRTWDDLMAVCASLRAAGIPPISMGSRYRCPATAWFDYLDMRLNGPAFHEDLMALRVPYTDDRVRKVFDFWRDLLDQDLFLGDPAEYDEDEAVAAVLHGEAGMTLIGAYITDEYVPEGETDLDFFRFPIIDRTLPIGEDSPVDGYFVAGNTAAPEDASAFLAHLGSREVQERMVEAMTALPVRKDIDLTRGGRHLSRGSELLRSADTLTQFYDLDTPWELSDVGMNAFMAFMREPERIDELLIELEEARLRQRKTHHA